MKRLIPIITIIIFLSGCASLYKTNSIEVAKKGKRLNKMCPVKIEKGLTLVSVETKDRTFFLHYNLANNIYDEMNEEFRKGVNNPDLSLPFDFIENTFKEIKIDEHCKGESKKYMVYGDVEYHYFYKTEDEKHSFDFLITKDSCD